jgi:hypothetical protein
MSKKKKRKIQPEKDEFYDITRRLGNDIMSIIFKKIHQSEYHRVVYKIENKVFKLTNGDGRYSYIKRRGKRYTWCKYCENRKNLCVKCGTKTTNKAINQGFPIYWDGVDDELHCALTDYEKINNIKFINYYTYIVLN